MADYGKQKSGKPRRTAPPHREHNEPGGPANPFGAGTDARSDKAALLARMREAARPKGGESLPEEPTVRTEGEA